VTKHQERNQEHAEYLAWIHTRPCAACGTRKNIQAAHVGRGGVGMKHGSDAETIPLCGPRMMAGEFHGEPQFYSVQGCHADHDQCRGQFRLMTRAQRRAWDAHQVAVHRGLFEARNVDAQGECPF
jgi:hypothetical protein